MKSLTKNNLGIDLDLFSNQRKEMFDAVSEGKLLSKIEEVFKDCRNSQEQFNSYQSIFQGMESSRTLREELAELFEAGICNVEEPTPVLDFDDSLIDSKKYPLVYSLICKIKENHKAERLMFNPRFSGSGYNWFSDRSNYTSISKNEELLSFASKVFVENVFLEIAEARKFSCYFSVKEQRFIFADESSYTYKRDIENGKDPVIDFFKDKIVLDYFTVLLYCDIFHANYANSIPDQYLNFSRKSDFEDHIFFEHLQSILQNNILSEILANGFKSECYFEMMPKAHTKYKDYLDINSGNLLQFYKMVVLLLNEYETSVPDETVTWLRKSILDKFNYFVLSDGQLFTPILQSAGGIDLGTANGMLYLSTIRSLLINGLKFTISFKVDFESNAGATEISLSPNTNREYFVYYLNKLCVDENPLEIKPFVYSIKKEGNIDGYNN